MPGLNRIKSKNKYLLISSNKNSISHNKSQTIGQDESKEVHKPYANLKSDVSSTLAGSHDNSAIY